MIGTEYVRLMARYNLWQNAQIAAATAGLPADGWGLPRRGFWSSIGGTLSHLVWGDLTWLARFDGGTGTAAPQAESAGLCPTREDWIAERRRIDRRIVDWAGALTPERLAADLSWYSGSVGAELSRPLALLCVHFFNHQTHHRGQVHQMLTEAGLTAPVSDLFLMPDTPEDGWFD